MISEEVANAFRKKYSFVHPLLLQRSLERACDANDLFEILESLPQKPPFSWDEETHSWSKDMDVAAKRQLKKMMSRKKS